MTGIESNESKKILNVMSPIHEFIEEYHEIVHRLGEEWNSVKEKLQGPNAAVVLYHFANYAEAVEMTRQVTVPVLAQDFTAGEHMNWLVASRKHSAHDEVARLRLKRLEAFL